MPTARQWLSRRRHQPRQIGRREPTMCRRHRQQIRCSCSLHLQIWRRHQHHSHGRRSRRQRRRPQVRSMRSPTFRHHLHRVTQHNSRISTMRQWRRWLQYRTRTRRWQSCWRLSAACLGYSALAGSFPATPKLASSCWLVVWSGEPSGCSWP